MVTQKTQKKKIITSLLFLSILFLSPFADAAVITVRPGVFGTALCPRETGVFIDIISNTNTNIREFSVTTRGSAASWTVVTPQHFILAPGEEKTLYTYVTPVSNAAPGNYLLELVIAAGPEVKTVQHTVVLKNCFDVTVQSPTVSQNACPRHIAKYDVFITNTGAYQEDFILRADGLLKASVTLSDTILSLKAGERRKVDAYVVAPADNGQYGFSIVAAGKSGRSIQTVNAALTVQPCYTFTVAPQTQVASLCEAATHTIPITLENRGTVTNNYLTSVAGPSWAKIDTPGMTLLAGQSNVFNLFLTPDYGTHGMYRLTVETNPERGDLKALTDIDVTVRKCASVDVQTVQNDQTLCADGRSRTMNVLIQNDGEVAKQYALTLTAPAWITTNAPALFTLRPAEQQLLALTAQPRQDVAQGPYTATIHAQATDASGVVAQDTETVRMDVLTIAACYAPHIASSYNNLIVYYDGSVTLPITVQNAGIEQAQYEIVLSGAGTSFAKLNPGIVTVAPGTTETVYLYLAPGPHTPLTSYDLVISVKLPDSGVLATEKIAIRVTDNEAEATKIGSITNTNVATWWIRFKAWLYRNFVPQPAIEGSATEDNGTQTVAVNLSLQKTETVVPTGEVVSARELWNRARDFSTRYRYYTLGAIIVLLVILLLARLNFWNNAMDFFLEEEEQAKKNGRKKKDNF